MYHIKDQLFRAIFDQLPDLRIIVRADQEHFPVVLCNAAFTDISGITAEDTTGKPLSSLLVKTALDVYIQRTVIQQAILSLDNLRQTCSDSFYAAFTSEDTNNGHWWRLEVSPVRDNNNSCDYLMLCFLNVTEHISKELALKESKLKEESLINNQLLMYEQIQAGNENLAESQLLLKQLNEELDKINKELQQRVKIESERSITNQNRSELIIQNAPCAIALLDGPRMVVLSANKMLLDLWHSNSSIIGKPLLQVLPEIGRLDYYQQLLNVLSSGKPFAKQEATPLLGGEDKIHGYFNYIFHPVKNEDNLVTGVLLLAHEVTEQVKFRKVIQQNEFRLKKMVSNTPIAMTILRGRDLLVEIANQNMLEIWDRQESDILERPLLQIFPEMLDQPFPYFFKSILDTGRKVAIDETELSIKLKNGERKNIIVNISCDPLLDASGEVESILLTMIDVSATAENRRLIERKNAELTTLQEELIASNEELKVANEELDEIQVNLNKMVDQLVESEGKIRNLVDQAPVGICLLSGPEMTITLVNDVILRIWHRTRDEVIGKPHTVARPEMKGSMIEEWLTDTYTSGIARENNEVHIKLYNGPDKPLRDACINSQYQPLRNSKNEVIGLIIILNDVTQIVEDRARQRSTQERYAMAVESAELGTWNLDIVNDTFHPSERLKSMFGYEADEDMSLADALRCVDKDYIEYVNQTIDATLQTGEKHDIEFLVQVHRDTKRRWLRAKGKLFYDAGGTATHYSGTVLDITTQKLEAIRKNDFIAIVSHELKTPLTSLKAYVQLLQNKYSGNTDTPLISSGLAKCMNQIEKMSILIKGFLDIARLENSALYISNERFDIYELLYSSVQDVLMISQTHHIQVFSDASVQVSGDKEKIAQVVSNLLSNAIKYSPIGTSVDIDFEVTDKEVIVKISDEGIGIRKEDQTKIFDRFYRIESNQTQTIAGFGIGLYLCKEIIARHKGRIWVESEKGIGSHFYFSLPLNP